MLHNVLGKGHNESFWISELGSPGLVFLDVIGGVFALRQVLWEFLDKSSNFLDSLDDVFNITLGGIGIDLLEFLLDDWTVFEAFLDFWKVILGNKSLDHTGKNFFGSF